MIKVITDNFNHDFIQVTDNLSVTCCDPINESYQ